MATSSDKWVVVASETVDGETTCQVVSEEYDTMQEADDFAASVRLYNSGMLVEVATVEEAAAVVTE